MKQRITPIFFFFFVFCILACPKDHVFAGIITVRTEPVETINSLSISTTSVYSFTQPNSSRVAVYALTFSLKAFGADFSIPQTIIRKTDAVATNTLTFLLENRKKKEVRTGFAVASIIPESASSTPVEGRYYLPQGEARSFTALIAYTDARVPDQENRVRITEMPLSASTRDTPILLNQSELQRLTTDFAELY